MMMHMHMHMHMQCTCKHAMHVQVRHISSSARRLRDMHLSTSFVEHSLRPGIAGRTPHAALVRA